MSIPAIAVNDLRKRYRRFGRPPEQALAGVNLEVEAGGVHGFLGPNGSGKTTTIRILLGLARADSGSVQIFGREVPRELPAVVGHVGALVENPLFLPGVSGRAQLVMLAQSVGIPKKRVEEVLELVRLGDRADDRVKGYSLGMRQRLGIAAALLKDPQLLILDEPSNGLDPAGMKEMRELVRELGTERTVFLSSHLLTEVSQVCDRVSIMSQGRCLVQGPVAQVLASQAGGTRVVVEDAAAAATVLTAAGYAVTAVGEALQIATAAAHDPSAITRLLGERGLWLRELSPIAADLETAFLEITSGQGLGEQPVASSAAPEGSHA
jgi:ABC-2 type transport system ATP-binding protein